jgi:hypothetical protein
MKCPVCNEVPEDFREHAFNHVRADEAYAIETWDHLKHKPTLVLQTIAGPLNPNALRSLRHTLGASQSLMYGVRLKQIERKQKIRKND